MFAIRYKTIFYMWFVIAGLTLGGCSTTDLEIARVDKNLDEGRLLPTDALDTTDVLNQYSHDYPPPNVKNMAIYIDVDRKKLFTQGGEVYMQLALATRPATPAPVHMHVLVYDEHVASSEHLNFQNEIIESLYKADQAFHTGSTFSLDTSANTNSRQTKYPTLLSFSFERDNTKNSLRHNSGMWPNLGVLGQIVWHSKEKSANTTSRVTDFMNRPLRVDFL